MIGRYILSPNVMRNLNKIEAGAGGEIQLTDAIAKEIAEQRAVYGYKFEGTRFDCGSKSGFLQATVACALFGNLFGNRVCQLDSPARAGLDLIKVAHDIGRQDIAADHGKV